MKLQGKKTGAVANFIGYIDPATPIIDLSTGNTVLTVRYVDAGVNCYKNYKTVAELNEDWEDYKPIEPRIEDPKARKIFREWADLCGAKQFRVCHHDNFGEGKTTSIWSTDIPTEPEIELPGHIGKDSETYTITELVGEEEE